LASAPAADDFVPRIRDSSTPAGRLCVGPNDEDQLQAALRGQNPSRWQEARPVSCIRWFGLAPWDRQTGPRRSWWAWRGGIGRPGPVAHLEGGSDIPLCRRRGHWYDRPSPPSRQG